jgi:hypothetical protein
VGKVFISYSHDSREHSERVLALSDRLRALGVDAELDRYHVRPPQGWPHWCEEQLRPEISSFVLVICTSTYRARVEKRVGADEGRGVYWEGAILYNYLYNAKGNSRFVPILLDEVSEAVIPLPLDGHTRYRICSFELTDSGFEALYRELTGQPETLKPTLGDVIRLNALGAPMVGKQLPDKEAVTDFRSVRRFWSPFSDEESVDRGEVRFWAIVETLAAMTAFWWFAIYYETFLLLTTGLFIAPLLLLRSDKSTRLAVRWIDTGMFPPRRGNVPSARAEDERSLWRLLGIGAAVGMAVGFGLGYPGATFDLLGRDWIVGAGGAVLAAAAVGALATGALETAGFGAVGVTVTAMVAVCVGITVALGIAVGVAIAQPTFGPGAVAAGIAVAVAVAVAAAAAAAGTGTRQGIAGVAAGVAAGAVAGAGNATVLESIAYIVAPSFLLGLWFATLIFRFAATARHARDGYRRLPINVRRLALCMTPLQQPELLPSLPVNHRLRFSAALTDAFSELTSAFAGSNLNAISKLTGSNLKDRLIALSICIFVPLIFLPAWAYRFILKSTLWFWWILLIVGGAPRLDGGIEGLRADAYRKAWAWVGIATTLFAVVGFGFGWLLKPWIENVAAEAKLPTAVALLVFVDWKSIPLVQWITLASALTTLVALFWTQAVYVDSRNPQRAARVAVHLTWLGHLVKWKTGFGAVGIALLMLYFALYANAVHHYAPVSDWSAGWLRWLYGSAADLLRPV